MKAWWRAAAILSASAFLLPTAWAVPAGVDLFLQGPVKFPHNTESAATLAGIFTKDSTQIDSLSIDAAVLRLSTYEAESLLAPPGALLVTTRSASRSWDATGARVDLVSGGASQTGFIGFSPTAARAVVVETTTMLTWTAESNSRIGDADGPNAAQYPWYSVRITEPHLRATTSGALELRGSGAIKVYGPSLRIATDQNVTHHETGAREMSPMTVERRWLYLEFEDAILRIETAAPIELAAYELSHVALDGTVMIDAATGAVRVGPSQHEANAEPLSLTGAFTGRLAPMNGGRTSFLTLTGDLRGTSLASAPLAMTPDWGDGNMAPQIQILILGAAILATGTAVGAGAWLHRFRKPHLTLGECITHARVAANSQDSQHAAEWLGKAHKISPADPSILMEQAWHLARTGAIEQAHATYLHAARLLPPTDGSANLAAAILTFEHRANPGQAAREIATALDREPNLLQEIEAETDLYRGLQGNPVFTAATAEAARKLERVEQ